MSRDTLGRAEVFRWCALIALALSIPSPAASDPLPVVRIGVVLDGPQPPGSGRVVLQRRDELLQTVREQTVALTRRQFDVRFPDDKQVAADWTRAGIRRAVDRLLADPEVDVVVSVGPFCTNELVRRTDLPKPVIASWALDIQAQGLPLERDASGVDNLNYLVAPGSILRDLRKFKEIIGLSRVHIVSDRWFLEMIPEIPDHVLAAQDALGLELITVPGEDSAEAILAALPADAEGVYVTPLPRLSAEEFGRLVDGLIARRLPSFSFLGQDEVERGILAGTRSTTEITRIGRRVALNIQRILMGEDAGTLSVLLEQPERLMVNMATARATGVYPSWRVLVEAVQIADEPLEYARSLTFDQAVREAVQANLSLRATDRAVAAGAENVSRARSPFFPQLESFARGVGIDADRARASLGSQAERTATAGLSVSQLLWSDAALANLGISKQLQRSLEWQRETERLDIALAAATAYLDVLRAATLERVERDNARLTESHLDLARRRERLGASGAADVYRWESRLATDRAEVIRAQNRTLAAKAVLNRLLHRPLEEPFVPESPGLQESWLVTCGDRLLPYVDNPALYRIFREFSVEQGLLNSVELRALDRAVAAQERVLLAARRSYWSPEIGLRGDVDRDFARGGAGSEAVAALPGFPERADRDDWSIALSATLPLWSGGARAAGVRKAQQELAGLRLERQALAEAIELRIRVALFEAGSTYPAIDLAREAARAARDNLELVTDAYSRGAVSIIELLDAQNADVAAGELAANAVYEFLLDLMEGQRATNTFDFFISDEGRDAWFERLRAYFEQAGVKVRPSAEVRP